MTAQFYIIGAVVSVIILLVSVLIANKIEFQPDTSDVKSRKTWFWIISILAPVLTFLLGYLLVYMGLKVPSQKTAAMTAMLISAGVSWAVYLVLGIIVSKAFKSKKVGSWFN